MFLTQPVLSYNCHFTALYCCFTHGPFRNNG